MSKEQAKALFKDGETKWEKQTMDEYTDVIYEDIDKAKDYVIEQGSNSNGHWEKWASGKLIQWGSITITNGTTQSIGVLWRSNASTYIQFPVEFQSSPSVQLSNKGPGAFGNMVQDLNTQSCGIRLVHVYEQVVKTDVSWLAIGTYK